MSNIKEGDIYISKIDIKGSQPGEFLEKGSLVEISDNDDSFGYFLIKILKTKINWGINSETFFDKFKKVE